MIGTEGLASSGASAIALAANISRIKGTRISALPQVVEPASFSCRLAKRADAAQCAVRSLVAHRVKTTCACGVQPMCRRERAVVRDAACAARASMRRAVRYSVLRARRADARARH